jgi:WD40 repeat protein
MINNNDNSNFQNNIIINPQFTFNPLSIVNINEITKDPDNSLLKLKINPNKQGEFIIINSNFTMNYLSFNPQTISLSCNGIYSEHKSRINDISFFHSSQSPLSESFVSGDNDGIILLWDSRAKSSSYKLTTHGKGAVLSLDTNQNFLAAGYGTEISAWDLKTMKQIGKSHFAHSELVTCVKFFENYLITGGEDNIINIFDIYNENEMNKKINKNILTSENVASTMNMGQSIFSVSTMKPNYISAITTVNTFFIIDLKSCVQTYEFDAKNNITDYILESYFDSKNDIIQLACGAFNGIICTINFNVEKPQPYLRAIFNTGIEQTFNSIGRFNDDVFIACSDHGLLYLLQEKKEIPKNFDKNKIKQYNLASNNDYDEDIEMK